MNRADHLSTLGAKYGSPRRVTATLPSLNFPPMSERKQGEVCMAIRRRSGGFLLHTKKSYPNAIMRLPTGGIKGNEDIEEALFREIWEETNLEVRVARFVAEMSYRAGDERTHFQTFLFLCEEVDGDLRTNDPNEQITAWVEAKSSELPRYADELRRIIPSWSSWGHFRAAALDVLAEHCDRERC